MRILISTRKKFDWSDISPNAIARFFWLLPATATEDRNIKDVSLNNEDWSEAATLAAFDQSLTGLVIKKGQKFKCIFMNACVCILYYDLRYYVLSRNKKIKKKKIQFFY
jgi:hypothetical protein